MSFQCLAHYSFNEYIKMVGILFVCLKLALRPCLTVEDMPGRSVIQTTLFLSQTPGCSSPVISVQLSIPLYVPSMGSFQNNDL